MPLPAPIATTAAPLKAAAIAATKAAIRDQIAAGSVTRKAIADTSDATYAYVDAIVGALFDAAGALLSQLLPSLDISQVPYLKVNADGSQLQPNPDGFAQAVVTALATPAVRAALATALGTAATTPAATATTPAATTTTPGATTTPAAKEQLLRVVSGGTSYSTSTVALGAPNDSVDFSVAAFADGTTLTSPVVHLVSYPAGSNVFFQGNASKTSSATPLQGLGGMNVNGAYPVYLTGTKADGTTYTGDTITINRA